MKFISKFLTISFVLIIIGASFSSEDASPAIAAVLSYACYRLVFKGMRSQSATYDPINFVD